MLWPVSMSTPPEIDATPGTRARAASRDGGILASMLTVLFGASVLTFTSPREWAMMLLVTPSRMLRLALATLKAMPTAEPTAIAMTPVRRGSRTRLARPSRTGAVLRVAAPRQTWATMPANAPTASRKPSAVTSTPSGATVACHGSSAPWRWPTQAMASPAKPMNTRPRVRASLGADSERSSRLPSSAATSMRVARRTGTHDAATAITAPSTAPMTNAAGPAWTVIRAPMTFSVKSDSEWASGRARSMPPNVPAIPPATPSSAASASAPAARARGVPPTAATMASSRRRSSSERLSVL